MKQILTILSLLVAISAYNQNIQESSLKILSWNIYMLPQIVPRIGRLNRAESIAEQLNNSDFDIIVFQEAFMKSARDIISATLIDNYPYQYGPGNEQGNNGFTNSGVWIVSKIPLDLICEIEYKAKTGFDKLARKGAFLYSGAWHGQDFQIVGTHLQADNYSNIRNQQLLELASMLDKHIITNTPQIICGDLNTIMNTSEYYKLLDILKADNGKISGEQQNSYDGEHNEIARFYGVYNQITVDYILFRNNGIKTNINRTISIIKSKKRHLSDHYGIASEIFFY